MSGKTGSKPTGRKPQSVRRQSDKADGAFGKEGVEQIAGKRRTRNMDKAVLKKVGGGGAA